MTLLHENETASSRISDIQPRLMRQKSCAQSHPCLFGNFFHCRFSCFREVTFVILGHYDVLSLLNVFIYTLKCGPAGGSERADPGDSCHFQRNTRLPRLLASVQHHGRQSVRRQIQQVCRQRWTNAPQQRSRQQVHLPRDATSQLYLVHTERNLQQRWRFVLGSVASGRLHIRHACINNATVYM